MGYKDFVDAYNGKEAVDIIMNKSLPGCKSYKC
jgi:hypothetical protein